MQVGNNHKNTVSDKDISKIKEFLETMQYGYVTIVVQDGKVIQLEKCEKLRVK